MRVDRTSTSEPAVFAHLVGQQRARRQLSGFVADPVHAYLFVGPPGAGTREAARAFAAALVCPEGGCGRCASCSDTLAGRHPDVVVVERQGASISVDEARAVTNLAQRAPRAATRQVIVLDDFHLVDQAAPALLKTIEEPPDTTVFVVLADSLAAPLQTIASRCVQVVFEPLEEATIARALEHEGVEHSRALAAASASDGQLDKARLLTRDEGFGERIARWRAVPDRLDGSGATVAVLAAELVEAADELVAVLKTTQDEELERAREAATLAGERALPGRQAIEERHRREQRRLRNDELRAGLAVLARSYRDRLAAPECPPWRSERLAACCEEIDRAAAALVRNPNEGLLVQALLLALDGQR